MTSFRHRAILNARPCDIARFWSKVRKTETCWLWKAKDIDKDGYGNFWCFFTRVSAPRFIYYWTYGELNPDLPILHSCDNPGCVRPTHLSQGTQSNNILQCVERGRHRNVVSPASYKLGSFHGAAKLTEAQVVQIRIQLALGVLQKDIAKEFNVSPGVISAIKCKRSWRYIQ